ncbi:MAG: ABC transporter ATP-binding protein [Planctomycetales bacterium]
MSETKQSGGLTIRSVSHAFGSTNVVCDASLNVNPGEIHCLLGPSGSGKTTLLRLVGGLERLQSGEISISAGIVASPVSHLPPERRSVGFVFQDFALFPHLNVGKNVMFGMSRQPRLQRHERMRSLLQMVGLSKFETAMPHTLSGGQQQRVALVRALARDPQVMLLDEPFSGLDAQLRDEVRNLAVDVLKSIDVATLLVTHDRHEAMMVADTISIIHEGRIEQTGPPRQLYHQPVNETVATALGEMNSFSCQVVDSLVHSPIGKISAESFRDGDRVIAMCRPESVSVEVRSEASDAVIRAMQFIGNGIRIEATTPSGSLVVATTEPASSLQIGSQVNLSVDSLDVVLVAEPS